MSARADWKAAYRRARVLGGELHDHQPAKTALAVLHARRAVGRPRGKYTTADPAALLNIARDLRQEPREEWSLSTLRWLIAKVREIRGVLAGREVLA